MRQLRRAEELLLAVDEVTQWTDTQHEVLHVLTGSHVARRWCTQQTPCQHGLHLVCNKSTTTNTLACVDAFHISTRGSPSKMVCRMKAAAGAL